MVDFAMRLLPVATFLALLREAHAQQVGKEQLEEHPTIPLQTCTQGQGCTTEQVGLTLDAQFRWIHSVLDLSSCSEQDAWNSTLCPDAWTCGKQCAIEGVGASWYQDGYGVSTTETGVSLRYVTQQKYGTNIGSRLYLMDGDASYRLFRLKNRELSFDVDVSQLPCGLNGAMYFVEMEAGGGKGIGSNDAGAKYGTGYCDAQCPRLRWLQGQANIDMQQGLCCSELDIWEANSMDTVFTSHPCSTTGPQLCQGEECGGLCDKDGCDLNTFRLRNKAFYGLGGDVDTARPFSVVTQFVTADGTDSAPLAELRRFYVQDGRTIASPESAVPGIAGSSMSDSYCEALHDVLGAGGAASGSVFSAKGGLRSMGEALDRGMVLVLALWDDPGSQMRWLDSTVAPGDQRGMCSSSSGAPDELRGSNPDASVVFSNFKVGELGSTAQPPPEGGGAAPAPPPAQERQPSQDGLVAQMKDAELADAAPAPMHKHRIPAREDGGSVQHQLALGCFVTLLGTFVLALLVTVTHLVRSGPAQAVAESQEAELQCLLENEMADSSRSAW